MHRTAIRRPRPCVVPVHAYPGDPAPPAESGRPDEEAAARKPQPSPLCRGARAKRR